MTGKRQVVIQAADSGMQDRLRVLLSEFNCTIRPGRTPAEALALVRSSAPELLVAVFGAGDGDPVAFLSEVADLGVPVLILAGEPDVEIAVSCIRAGALDFLLLPLDEDRIRKIFEKVFGRMPSAAPEGDRSIVTCDAGMKRTIDLAVRVAASRAPVFVQGESGTGKELFARLVHDHSDRAQGPFVAVNCAALPENLLESELFGHEKGAFTGATAKKAGKFELADGGTLLLDEVTEMPVHLQAKLLRVLQEGEVDRIGGGRPVRVDVRIVATTNRDLKKSMEEGEFREDLYHRLNTIPLRIPPLRQRKGDVPLLARHFVEKYNQIDGRCVRELTEAAAARLCSVAFSGNVRELENVIRRAVLLCDGIRIQPEDLMMEEEMAAETAESLSPEGLPEALLTAPLKEVEKQMILHTLRRTDGNRTHAAQLLGISVRTLRNKLNEYRTDAPLSEAL